MDLKLNRAQQKAVDQIYGPLLVIAGPGTGKTQLLSARIANILKKTDANASNILCLTFTENAALNMRSRLTDIIGAESYDVHIGTYHSFGRDIIRSYPQYFETINLETGKDSRLERPIDELQQIQILESILDKLPYSSPLIGAKHYIRHLLSTISELKRGLYTPVSLKKLTSKNAEQAIKLSPKIAECMSGVKRLPGSLDKSLTIFQPILSVLEGLAGLAKLAHEDLELAIEEAEQTKKSKPLTAWKNKWLTKDDKDNYCFTDQNQHLRMLELVKIYSQYNEHLSASSLYDFDDMILRSIDALKQHDELRYNLQEKYQFILLDEFQDTNAAQFELVKQLTNNPVNEGQPNVFAVGDDDQAIYAFQGAEVGNMFGFIKGYRDVAVVNLTENYRSHADILDVAKQVSGQIESRLHHSLEGIDKELLVSSTNLPKVANVDFRTYDSQANEYGWVASKVNELVKQGVSPKEIAVLAPKHALLEQIVPFMASHSLPIAYEKRENILQTKLIRSYRLMARLVQAVTDDNQALANELFPRVLSLEFFDIPAQDIWNINWLSRSEPNQKSWTQRASLNPTVVEHVNFFLSLGLKSSDEPLEYILDYLTGSTQYALNSQQNYTSPLKSYYFKDKDKDPLTYYESLANLSTIREHLRNIQAEATDMLHLSDFLDFIHAYEVAELPLINSHPIALAEEAVQLMTVYKAKGLEFEHVFLLSMHDDIWGKKARSNTNKISLPENLKDIRYQGSSEDELLRLLFVAITRAKHGLYLTAHANKDNGKATEPVKYLLPLFDGLTPEAKTVSPLDAMHNIELLWEARHLKLDTSLKHLLKDRLSSYQMSPTHLNTITDPEYGGWEVFLLNSLLRFPTAPGVDGEFGNAVHMSLEWYQNTAASSKTPSIDQLLAEFSRQLSRRYIPKNKLEDLTARGVKALRAYTAARTEMFSLPAKTEVNFKNEGVTLGPAHLTGKIDRLEINEQEKTLGVVDFKTGKPSSRWEKSIKLTKYKQQLYFYKFLIEGSNTWKGYSVSSLRLEFVEPQPDGSIVPPLILTTDPKQEKQLKELITETWRQIVNLDFLD